jgi:hypothetical protein
MNEFRLALVRKLKERPNLLPPNVRIFIPVDCRERGKKNNKILMNPQPIPAQLENNRNNQEKQKNVDINPSYWPLPILNFDRTLT